MISSNLEKLDMSFPSKKKSIFHRENNNLSYQKLNLNPKLTEIAFKQELAQILKDIADKSKKDADLYEKFQQQFSTDDFKQKFREAKVEANDYSLLHIAAKHCRTKICKFLIEEIKIGKLIISLLIK